MENSTALSNGKGSNADKVQDSETSLLVFKKVNKNYIEDTETTPKSCLDVVFELLATTACSSSNSLLESVRQVSTSSRKTSIKCAVTGSRMTEEVPAEFRCILSGAIASARGFKRQTRES